MKKHIAVSFENELVRLVYANTGRGGFFIEKTLTFSNEEFDRFLATTKDDEFIVVQNFQNIYQDIISLPPAREKYLEQLVELEIKKRIPELREFSFFYTELREVQREGKRSKDVFFFAVEKSEVEETAARFTAHGKVVTHVYPNVLALSRFLHVADIEPGEPVMGVLDVGSNKTIFLIRENRLYFVRVAQSGERGIQQTDVESINMTIAYCRQVLRMSPSRVALLGTSGNTELPVAPVVPLASVKFPSSLAAFDDTSNEYVVPISALLHYKELESGNLLPATYRDVVVQRKVMVYCIIVLLLLSFLGLAYLGFQSFEIVRSKKAISQLRGDIDKRRAIIGDFEGTLARIQKLTPSVDLANSFSSSFDMQKVLESIQVFALEGVDVRSIDLKNEQEAVRIHVEGNIKAISYEELQSRYEGFLAGIKKTGKMEVEKHKLDLKQKGFVVDIKWKA